MLYLVISSILLGRKDFTKLMNKQMLHLNQHETNTCKTNTMQVGKLPVPFIRLKLITMNIKIYFKREITPLFLIGSNKYAELAFFLEYLILRYT